VQAKEHYINSKPLTASNQVLMYFIFLKQVSILLVLLILHFLCCKNMIITLFFVEINKSK